MAVFGMAVIVGFAKFAVWGLALGTLVVIVMLIISSIWGLPGGREKILRQQDEGRLRAGLKTATPMAAP